MPAEIRKKIGQANRGNKRPDVAAQWERYRITGNRTDAPIRFRTPELLTYHCEQCGKEWQGRKNGLTKSRQRHFCGYECQITWRAERMIGELNRGYIHGQGSRPYPLSFKKIRRAIKERDGYFCQRCGKEEIDSSHHVHHIDFDKRNTNADNLITLCPSCHSYVTAKKMIGWSALKQGDCDGMANQNL